MGRIGVDSVAAGIEGAMAATGRWEVGAVLGVVAELAGDDLLGRVIRRLPPGYAPASGRRARHEGVCRASGDRAYGRWGICGVVREARGPAGDGDPACLPACRGAGQSLIR